MDLVDAMHARDAGMEQALAHAEAEHPQWGTLAYLFLSRFASKHKTFISEDVSDASIEWGMCQPPTLRSWGSIYTRAQRNGLIVDVGDTGRSRCRHASKTILWHSNIFRETA